MTKTVTKSFANQCFGYVAKEYSQMCHQIRLVLCIQRCHTVYRGVLISGGWNRGVPLYTEVFSFQEVGNEYTEVSPFLGVGMTV